jgi:DNA-directed RNA polymerase subunit RPC12/RpoP
LPKGIVLKKPIIFGLLMLAVVFFLWRVVATQFSDPSDTLAVRGDKENLEWFSCSNCSELFMAEATTKKGHCPYCQFQMMLETESKRVLGKGVDESEFVWFLSDECGNVFFAHETQKMGSCPYCKEPIELTTPISTDLEQSPPQAVTWARVHGKELLAIALGVFAISMTGFYILRERQIMLSLSPIDETLSSEMKIELTRHQLRKKELTLAGNEGADIVLRNPALRDLQLILSFVRVGGKTHSYLHPRSNLTLQVNEKPVYNPRLKDHDKVQLGDIVFEVFARED